MDNGTPNAKIVIGEMNGHGLAVFTKIGPGTFNGFTGAVKANIIHKSKTYNGGNKTGNITATIKSMYERSGTTVPSKSKTEAILFFLQVIYFPRSCVGIANHANKKSRKHTNVDSTVTKHRIPWL